MAETLVVGVAQPACMAHDVAANVAAHVAAVEGAEGARLVVFPELSLTGYELAAEPVAPEDPRLVPLIEACGRAGVVALAGAPFADGPTIAMLAVDGAGARLAYRKVWVDRGEAGRFVPGPGPVAFDVDGWRVGLAICRDTGIVRHTADLGALGVDLYVAGTLMHERDAAEQDRRARATATALGVPVAIASFAGSTGDGFAEACGRSGFWGADGTVLAQAGREPGAVLVHPLRREVSRPTSAAGPGSPDRTSAR